MIAHTTLIGFARNALGLSQDIVVKIVPLRGRGSDRSFFRLTWGSTDSAILIHYDSTRVENTCYSDIAIFLRTIDVPAPALLHHDPDQCIMIMEDLGTIDLWTLRNKPWEIRQELYKKTLTVIHKLHSFPAEKFPADQVKLMEPFGPELYKWEREYFRDNFVSGVCKIKMESAFERQLEGELQTLAEHVHAVSQSLIHRDFQSQNVMIRRRRPYLIDFQGMRFGNPYYDLGSLLCDPYVNLSEEELDELLSFCYQLTERAMDWEKFQQDFWHASTQRLMQALGAYGFLGLTKGLTAFLYHIPAGLTNLQRAASHIPFLSHFMKLLEQCRHTLK